LYKIVFIVLALDISAYAQSLVAPKEIYEDMAYVFKENIPYENLKITCMNVDSNIDALKKIKNLKSQFAVVRGDILYNISHVTKDYSRLKDNYIVLSKLPYTTQLYLLQSKEKPEIYLDELKYKKVSIDNLGNSSSAILKQVLNMYGVSFYLDYKALSLENSLEELSRGKIDAYFGFIRKLKQHQQYNVQSIFSKKTIGYLKKYPNGLEVGDYEVYAPYVLVAHKDTSDKEIESIIYRLKKKKLFSAITTTKYGMINSYLLQHLKEVEKVIAKEERVKQSIPKISIVEKVGLDTEVCKKYHYGFLKLLRRKPSIKKVLKKVKRLRPKYDKQGKLLLKRINEILIDIDAKKEKCDMKLLKEKKYEFLDVEKKIKSFFILTY